MNLLSAHNGYLEVFCDGGWVGVGLLVLWLLVAGFNVSRTLLGGGYFGRVGFAVWINIVSYNWSEASFFRSTVLWFTFLLFAMRTAEPLPSASAG